MRASEEERITFLAENPDYGYGPDDTSVSGGGGTARKNGGPTSNKSEKETSSSFLSSPSPSLLSPAVQAQTQQPAQTVSHHRRAIDSIRERDFPHLLQPLRQQKRRRGNQQEQVVSSGRSDGQVYLDHAGATLYGVSQLKEAMEPLLGAVHGNPHSQVGVAHG